MKPIIQYFIKAGQRARSASNKGFSLMEMIVSIAVMTVLLGSLTPQVIVYINKANKAADVLTAATIYNAFVTLMADHSKYTLPPRARSIYDEEINSKDKPYRTTFLNAFYGSGNSNNNLIYKVRTVYDNKLEEYYYCCITRTEYLDGDAMRFSTSRWKTRYNHGKYYLQFNDPGGVLSRFISQEVNQFLSTTRLEVKCMHPEDETRIKTLRIDNLWNVYLTTEPTEILKTQKPTVPISTDMLSVIVWIMIRLQIK
ncbi:MAG: type II secretion system protein [Firmicutes bacterium]|nr:type II secretion system protein [Bacillota bacterium]